MSSFTINSASNDVKLDDKRAGTAIFNVANTTDKTIRGTPKLNPDVNPKGATDKDWLNLVGGTGVRSFDPKEIKRFTVEIKAPPAARSGEYFFSLNISNDADPNADFQIGPAVKFKVEDGTPPPPPSGEKKKDGKTWLIIVAVCVVVLGGVGLILWLVFGGKSGSKLQAAFKASASTVFPSTPVTFTDESVGNPISWLWDFDDGTTETNKSPSHTFQKPGTFNVTLKVTGSVQSDVASTKTAIQVMQKVRADFKAAPSAGPAPLEVTFLDDSDGNVVQRQWTFGDPGAKTSGEENPRHTYQKEGTYDVTLTVTGNSPGNQLKNESTHKIQIQVAKPSGAKFTATPLVGEAPLTVKFTDASSGNPNNWAWTFGDGGTATQRQATHTYANPGVYDVSLSVTGPGGADRVTMNHMIQVKVQRVLVPKVRGLDRQTAEAKLKQAGFTSRVSVQDLPFINFGRGGQVFDQEPAENTKAPKGSRVDLKAYR